jgi:hypothetical protein
VSGRWRLIAVVVVLVVAGGVAAAVILTQQGGGSFVGPSAAQLYAQQAKYGTFGAYVPGSDPDETDRGGNNVDDTVRFLGNDRYELTIQNVGFLGYINSFWWNAPNIVITKVISSSSGSCQAGSEKTVVTQYGALPEGSVRCQGMAIAPPKCSCEGGGTATVTFAGHPIVSKKGVIYGVVESRLVLGDLTLVPYHIPSYLGGAANQEDLPLCAKGQQSTKGHLCVHTS